MFGRIIRRRRRNPAAFINVFLVSLSISIYSCSSVCLRGQPRFPLLRQYSHAILLRGGSDQFEKRFHGYKGGNRPYRNGIRDSAGQRKYLNEKTTKPNKYVSKKQKKTSRGLLFEAKTPCNIFIWDGFSAMKYHVCRNLVQKYLYEGMGGKKFIRTQPGSVLDTLYPCTNHSPNACSICGHTFQDHLLFWWKSRRNEKSDYDLHLDKTYFRAKAWADGNSTDFNDDKFVPNSTRSSGFSWRQPRVVGKNVEQTTLCSGVTDGCGGTSPLAFSGPYFTWFEQWLHLNSDKPIRLSRDLFWYIGAPALWYTVVNLKNLDKKENNLRELRHETRRRWGV